MGETTRGIDLFHQYCDAEGEERMLLEDQLVAENWNLVFTVSIQFNHRRLGPDDLHAIGLIGLLKAIRTFDPDKGLAFSTYAMPCIRNEIFMEMRKFRAQRMVGDVGAYSLDMGLKRDEDNKEMSLMDLVAATEDTPTDTVMEGELRNVLEYILRPDTHLLTDFEKKSLVLTMEEKTQKEISEELGYSQSYVSRAVRSARKKFEWYLKKIGIL